MAKALYVGKIMDRESLTGILTRLDRLHAKDNKDFGIEYDTELNVWVINIFNEKYLIDTILNRTIIII